VHDDDGEVALELGVAAEEGEVGKHLLLDFAGAGVAARERFRGQL